MKIAIIGAGLAGLTLAHRLRKEHTVTVFEKARGVGGRMSTRYTSQFQFDHGAQYFTAHSGEFKRFLASFIREKVVTIWQPKLATLSPNSPMSCYESDQNYYVSAPKMNALCKSLVQQSNVFTSTRITNLEHSKQGWLLINEVIDRGTLSTHHHGPFDWVISSAPATQSIDLLPECFTHLQALKAVKQNACFALMLGFEEPLNLPFDSAKVEQSPIGWVSVDSSKPDRKSGYSLVVHSTNKWAQDNVDMPIESIQSVLLAALSDILDLAIEPSFAVIHRWLYANTSECASQPYFIDPSNKLAVCGDGLIDGRVEGAFLSANGLANHLLCDVS